MIWNILEFDENGVRYLYLQEIPEANLSQQIKMAAAICPLMRAKGSW